jgi:uncharacterized protein
MDRSMINRDRPGQNKTALVTGGAGGIGLEMTRLLAADGYDLVVVARDRQQLERVAGDLRGDYGSHVRVESRDLADTGAAARLWNELEAGDIHVDVLINNAGVGLYGPFDEQDPVALDRMVQLNMAALTTLTRLVLPGMRLRRWGRILNVASIVAYQPGGPLMAVYYATKAYVLSFSKGLNRELAGSGVSVTALAPGPTATDFDSRAGSNVNVLYNWLPKMSAAAVARAGYEGMNRGSTVVIPGVMTKILAVAGELPPRRIALEVNRVLWVPRARQRSPRR